PGAKKKRRSKLAKLRPSQRLQLTPSACARVITGECDVMLVSAFISNEGLGTASPVVVQNLANAK
ncbi:MAG TPA: hypothetical protein VK555_13690, partial [Terriglobales bacterium]|nr:hypothetical protein [Terriglobales bacterium]